MSSAADRLPPATGAWQEGDDPAWRKFADLGQLELEFGKSLPNVRVAYETWGEISQARDNAVLLQHALTADAHAVGPARPGQPTEGWWSDVVGPGKALDTNRWFVVAGNVLGGCQGTTGPSSLAPDAEPWGSRWPRISIRDQVAAEVGLADYLGIDRFAFVIGGSMGGMRSLEWAVAHQDRLNAAVILACGAVATADQIATQTAQIQAITLDPYWNGGDYHGAPEGQGPHRGMGIARRFAHRSYRTESEFAERFGNQPQPGEDAYSSLIPGVNADAGRFAVSSYLDYQADKLAWRFDAGTYVALTDAMNTFDVGRGRGGVASALASIDRPVAVAGLSSDRLYPLYLQRDLADQIPTVAGLQVIESPFGHDGFLLESQAVGAIVGRALARN